ncbi:MAG TPA: type II toxin-antitoxin system RelE/ParE family toxin [Paracoccaceae bacterium]|nr:type II toxin-antitoxin system RelE/ParE family toxin [Paracoccaceae bacterium]
MRLVFSPRSIMRMREIQAYIAHDNATAARRVVSRIRQSADMLADHPRLGTVWKGGPTRALVVSRLPYRIHYRIDETAGVVEVITVAHTSQKPPRLE